PPPRTYLFPYTMLFRSSGVTNYQRAILWGTAWTTGGSLVAAYFSQALVVAFSRGLIDPRFQISSLFLIAVLVGSIGWVLFATKTDRKSTRLNSSHVKIS